MWSEPRTQERWLSWHLQRVSVCARIHYTLGTDKYEEEGKALVVFDLRENKKIKASIL